MTVSNTNTRIFVTGGSGLLGWTLTRYLPHTKTLFQYWQHPLPSTLSAVQLNLLQPENLTATLDSYHPTVIINTAAYTDVAFCEENAPSAWTLNHEMPGWLASWAQKNGARLIHISTDLVFDGLKGNYCEEDPPNPVSVYSATKLAGENAVLSNCSNSVVLRLSIMGGTSFTGRRSLNEAIPLTLKRNGFVKLFIDEYRSAIWADNVAEIILELLDHDFTGLRHVPGGKNYSRHEIGEMIFRYFDLPLEKLHFGSVQEFTGSPPRCPDVTMDGSLLRCHLTTPIIDFASGFQLYLSSRH